MWRQNNTDLCQLIRGDMEQIIYHGHVHMLPSLGLKYAWLIIIKKEISLPKKQGINEE